MNIGSLVEMVTGLAAKLINIGVQHGTASEEERAELLAQADLDYAECRAVIAGMDAAIAKNNAEADAAAEAKPE